MRSPKGLADSTHPQKTFTMSERQSSIHVNSAKSTSEQHNNRTQELDYIFPEHSHKNEQWVSESIADRERKIKRLCKQISGRKLQKNAEPIREAVVNLQAHHTMEDLQKLKSDLEEKWDFEIFQMYIHRDEGASLKNEKGEKIEPKVLNPDKVNYHAHLVIDWQNKKTGKMLRYARGQMSKLQTDVAKSLNMKRGKERVADKQTANERLGIIQYKAKAQEEELAQIREASLKALQEQVEVLEQKKNEAQGRHDEAQREYERAEEEYEEVAGYDRKVGQQLSAAMERETEAREEYERLGEQIREIREGNKRREEEIDRYREVATILKERPDAMADFSEEEINGAIQYLEKEIRGVEEENSKLEEEYSNAQDDWRRKRNSD